MIGTMQFKAIFLRFGGIPFALIGLLMIFLPLLYGNNDGSLEDLLQRAGFGFLLMGLLLLFLFSIKTIPRDVSRSFIIDNGENTGRMLKGLNLHGKGIYLPPIGRLKEDRVYVPFEKHDLPVPDISDDTVFNVGSTGPSMGVSMVPPGKGFVDSVERLTSTSFIDDELRDGTESLQKLSKGTGMYKNIELKDRKDHIQLKIFYGSDDEGCSEMWKKYDSLHQQTGCPLCSAVICASARMAMTPLRIRKVSRDPEYVEYELEKVIR